MRRKRQTYQKVIRHGFLCRHASCILCCCFENPVSPPGPHDPPAPPSFSSDPAETPPILAIASGNRATVASVLSKFEDCSYVPAPVAIIWRRPDSHDTGIEHLLESFHDKLVRACDK